MELSSNLSVKKKNCPAVKKGGSLLKLGENKDFTKKKRGCHAGWLFVESRTKDLDWNFQIKRITKFYSQGSRK